MYRMRILVIESDLEFKVFLRRRLEEKCFAVDTACDGALGFSLGMENSYDLIILGHSLIGMDGYEVCAEFRRAGRHAPIIMVSDTADVFHKVDGFNTGIDDYVVRPCYFEELLARMHALLRRPPRQESAVLSFEDLTLDTNEQRVRRGKVSVYLTRKEFALLEYFLRNPERVLSRGQLFEHVWNRSVDLFSNTIETHIMNLRKKIDGPRKKRLIHSVSGRGYKLDVKR